MINLNIYKFKFEYKIELKVINDASVFTQKLLIK